MDRDRPNPTETKATARRLARGLLAIVQTRFELATVELQEAREHWVLAFLLSLGIAACGLLAGGALMVGLGMLLWPYSPALAAAIPFSLLSATSLYLYRKLMNLLRDWRTFPSTFEQLRKDRECLQAWLE